MQNRHFIPYLSRLSLMLLFSIVMVGSTFLPALSKMASAASGPSANATVIDLPTTDGAHAYSCQGFFTSAVANATLMQSAFSKVGVATIGQASDLINVPGLSGDQASFLENAWNNSQTLPIITFRLTTTNANPINGDINVEKGDQCSYYTMVPVNKADTEWVTLVGSDQEASTSGIASNWSLLTYSNPTKSGADTKGTFGWNFNYVGGCTPVLGIHTQKWNCGTATAQNISAKTGNNPNFIITGQPSTAQSGGTAINGVAVDWLNADQFTIASASGTGVGPDGTTINYSNYKGELYQKVYWGGTPASGLSYYFLQSSTAVDTNRTPWSSGQGCIDPMPGGASPNISSCGTANGAANTNCVPFFVITDDLDETDTTDNGSNPLIDASNSSNNQKTNSVLSGLQAAIDGLSAAPMTFYDYTPFNNSCVASTPVTLASGKITPTDLANAQIWLYYDAAKDQFKTVFQDATSGSNESVFIGTYSKSTSGTGIYEGPTNGSGCSGQILTTPNSTLNAIYPAKFTFVDASGGCIAQASIGYVNVLAETVNDTTYDAITSITSHTTTKPPSKNTCDNSPVSSQIDPVLCGIVTVVDSVGAHLDCTIGYFLKIDTNTIFNDSGSGGANSSVICNTKDAITASSSSGNINSGTANAYYTAWQAFRDIAYAMLVIIFLIMIAAQILDLDTFNAYALRKMLPAAAVAIPLIALSWNGQDFLYNLSNDAYDAIRAILAAPFTHVSVVMGNTTTNDATLALLLPLLITAIGAGLTALSFLSIGGIAMLVLAAGVAIFSAFVILIARTIVATFLIDWAPVAIMCAIYKPFRKGFDLWAALTAAILLSTPAVGAELQLSHDAAKVAFADGHAATSIIILIAGYALLWQIIKLMDKVAGRMGDLAASATRSLSKSAKRKAMQDFKYGLGRAVQGQDTVGGPKKLFAGVVRRSMLSRQGGFGITEKKRLEYKNAVLGMRQQVGKQAAKRDNSRSGGDDNMAWLGMTGVSREEYVRQYQSRIRGGIHNTLLANGSFKDKEAGGTMVSYASAFANLAERQRSATTPQERERVAKRRSYLEGQLNSEVDAESLSRARNSLAAAEDNFGARMGSDAMRVAAANQHFNSKTSYNERGGWFDKQGNLLTADQRKARLKIAERKTEAGQALTDDDRVFTMRGEQITEDQIDFDWLQARMKRDLGGLVNDGLMTVNDAVNVIKQRGDQVSRSGVGTSDERMLISNATARIKEAKSNGTRLDIKDVLSEKERDLAAAGILEGSPQNALIWGRHETLRAMVPVMARRMKTAAQKSNGATEEWQQSGIEIARIQKALEDATANAPVSAPWQQAAVELSSAQVEYTNALAAGGGAPTEQQQRDIDAKQTVLAARQQAYDQIDSQVQAAHQMDPIISLQRRQLNEARQRSTAIEKKMLDAQREYMRLLAEAAALQDKMHYAPPTNQQLFGNGLLALTVNAASIDPSALRDPTYRPGSPRDMSVLRAIDAVRGNRIFQQYRREYDSEFAAEMGGRDPNAPPGAVMGSMG